MSGKDFYDNIYAPVIVQEIPAIYAWDEQPDFVKKIVSNLAQVFDAAIEAAYLKGKNENSSN